MKNKTRSRSLPGALLFVVNVYAAASSPGSLSQVASPDQGQGQEVELGAWVEVDVSGMSGALESLTAGERQEQLRDWIWLAAIATSPSASGQESNLLYDYSPFRRDYLASLHDFDHGPARKTALPNRELLVMVPEGSSARRSMVGGAADEYRMEQGTYPRIVHVMEYRIHADPIQLAFREAEALKGREVFSPDWGYHEATVGNTTEVAAFLSTIDDLVYVGQSETADLRLGGRSYPDRSSQFDLEDLAVMYQADSSLAEQLRERLEDADVNSQYAEFLEQAVERLKAEQGAAESLRLIREAIREAFPYESFRDQMIENTLAEGVSDLSLGFSLDPKIHLQTLAGNLEAIANGDQALVDAWLDEQADSARRELEFELSAVDEEMRSLLQGFQAALAEAMEEAERSSPSADDEQSLLVDEVGEQSWASLLDRPAAQPSSIGDDLLTNLEAQDEEAESEEPDADALWRESVDEQVAERSEVLRAVLTGALQEKSDRLRRVAAQLRQGDEEALLVLRRSLSGQFRRPLARGSRVGAVEDLQRMLVEHDYLEGGVDGIFGGDTESAVRSLQEDLYEEGTGRVDRKLWAFLSERTEQGQRNRVLDGFLEHVRRKDSFQHARYDGRLQGSEVGMTLFYTDLMMKLWSFDYEGSSPGLAGFVPETRFPTSPVYWEETWRFPATRGWLGPLDSGAAFHEAGEWQELYFAPVATRLYNASSDDLFPGKEVAANPPSARFTRWWNDHYSEVADYEPEYHRLNQIVKWSVALAWLKGPAEAELAFLDSLHPGVQELDFKEWYRSNERLRTRVDLPFLERSKLGVDTEALDLIESESYRGLGEVAQIVGGVSLARKKEIADRVLAAERRANLDSLRIRRNTSFRAKRDKDPLDFGPSGGDRVITSDGVRYDFRGANEVIVSSYEQTPKFRGDSVEALEATLSRRVDVDPEGLKLSERVEGAEVAAVSVRQEPNRVVLSSPTDLLGAATTLTLLAAQEPSEFQRLAGRMAEVRDVLRGMDGADYVILRSGSGESGGVLRIGDGLGGGGGGGRFTLRAGHGGEDGGRPSRKHAFLLDDANRKRLADNASFHRLAVDRDPFGPPQLVNRASSEGPGPEAKPVRLQLRGKSYEAFLDRDGLVFETGPFPEGLEATAELRQWLDAADVEALAIRRRPLKPGTSLVLRSSSGEPLIVSNAHEPEPSAIARATRLLAGVSEQRLGMLLTDRPEGGIRIRESGTLELPKTPLERDLQLTEALTRRVEDDPTLVSTLDRLEGAEGGVVLEFLRIPVETPQLREAFVELHEVGVPPMARASELAIVDLRPLDEAPQLVYRTVKGGVRLVDLDPAWKRAEAEEAIRAFYAGEPQATYEAFLQASRGLVDRLERVVSETGAKVIVTREAGASDLATLWRLHGKDPSVRIFRDQPDVARSTEFALSEIPVDLDDAKLLVTAAAEAVGDEEFADIRGLLEEIEKLGPTVETGITWDRFAGILTDEESSILALVVRATEDGVLFHDREVSFFDLYRLLERLEQPRDLLFVVSNDMRVRDVVAESGSFKRSVLSRFTTGVRESLYRAVDNVKVFFEKALGQPDQTIDDVIEQLSEERLRELRTQELFRSEMLRAIPQRKVDLRERARPEDVDAPDLGRTVRAG